jgi:hypothetical protein
MIPVIPGRREAARVESITTPRLRLAVFVENKKEARMAVLSCANGPRAKRAGEYGFRACALRRIPE